jgi:hypothetical protein
MKQKGMQDEKYGTVYRILVGKLERKRSLLKFLRIILKIF